MEEGTFYLRVGVEALYEAADFSLLGDFEEVKALLRPCLDPKGFLIRGFDFNKSINGPRCPLKAAEREWVLKEVRRVVGRAVADGVAVTTIQRTFLVPLLAAKREAYNQFFRGGQFSAAKRAVRHETRGKGDRS